MEEGRGTMGEAERTMEEAKRTTGEVRRIMAAVGTTAVGTGTEMGEGRSRTVGAIAVAGLEMAMEVADAREGVT